MIDRVQLALAAVDGGRAARSLGIARTLGDLARPGGPPRAPSAVGGLRATDKEPPANVVALTFDDGPHPVGTPLILQILEAHGLTATFFVVGERVRRHPELVRETLDRGHVVALHGDRHRLQARLTAQDLERDIDRGIAAIVAATGAPPLLHRPPYGIYAPAGLEIARARGMTPLLWSRWGKDWRRLTSPARIAARVLGDGYRAGGIISRGGLRGGDVVLLHDADYYSSRGSYRRTAGALELIAGELSAREIGTVLPV